MTPRPKASSYEGAWGGGETDAWVLEGRPPQWGLTRLLSVPPRAPALTGCFYVDN